MAGSAVALGARVEAGSLAGWYHDLERLETPEELEEHFEELFCLDGFNITIPYKVRLMEQLDQLDTSARNHGAVNVVSIAADGKRCG